MKTIYRIGFPLSALGSACLSAVAVNANGLIQSEQLPVGWTGSEYFFLIGIIFAIVPIVSTVVYLLLKKRAGIRLD